MTKAEKAPGGIHISIYFEENVVPRIREEKVNAACGRETTLRQDDTGSTFMIHYL